jgi:hypothetical protein
LAVRTRLSRLREVVLKEHKVYALPGKGRALALIRSHGAPPLLMVCATVSSDANGAYYLSH